MAPRGETGYREPGIMSSAMDNIKGSKVAKVALGVGVAGVAAFGANKLVGCGDDDSVGYQGESVDGATPAQVSGQMEGAFKEAADSDISCRTFPGLKLNMTSFSVKGENGVNKDVEVVEPDVSDTLRQDAKYTDAIANPLGGESDNGKKLDLYTSFCDNPYLATTTANFLADLELPNGEKVADSVDWLKDYKDIKDVNDIAEERFPFKANVESDPAKLLEGMQANEELAANLIAVFEQLRYKGLEVASTEVNIHAPFPAANGELPEAAVNPEQMRAKGIGFNFVYKTNNGKGKEVLCIMFNKGDKRPEIVDCTPPKKTKTPPKNNPPKNNPPKKNPPKDKCVPPNPDCTDEPRGGKDHTKSPVSDDRNAKDERTRPNIPAPDKAIQKEGAGEDTYVPPKTVPDPRPEGQQTPDQTPASGTDNGNEDGTNGTVEGP